MHMHALGSLHVIRACNVFVLFSEAIHRNLSLSNVTDSEIQREIVRCLHGALDRDGGRRPRMKSPAVAASSAAAAAPTAKEVTSDEIMRVMLIWINFVPSSASE